jgi:hypothetical protein
MLLGDTCTEEIIRFLGFYDILRVIAVSKQMERALQSALLHPQV